MWLWSQKIKKPYQKIFIFEYRETNQVNVCKKTKIKNPKFYAEECNFNVYIQLEDFHASFPLDSHTNLNLSKSNAKKPNVTLKLMCESKTPNALWFNTEGHLWTDLIYGELPKCWDKPLPWGKYYWVMHSHLLWHYHHAASGMQHC